MHFSYDNQKRLSRIDYDASTSLRVEYAADSILLQYYDGAAPNSQKKYVFNISNGRIVTGKDYKPGQATKNLFYQYDNQQRLIEAGIRVMQPNGSLDRRFDCYFSYDAQHNMQELKFYSALSFKAMDSIQISRTYFQNRSFFTFKDIGFDYFGIASTGLYYEAMGIEDVLIPLPFFTFHIYPGTYAIKGESIAGKARELLDLNSQWKDASGGYMYSEDQHQYDQQGRIIKSGLFTFEWQ